MIMGSYLACKLPDNATRSFMLSPTAVNFAVMLLKLSKGAGIEVLAPA